MSVTLRRHEKSDVAELFAASRESLAEVSPWMQWCHAGYSMADAAAWVEKCIAGHRDGTMYEFAIVDERGAFVGDCGINDIDRVDGFAAVSYWVRTSRAGRGCAASAVSQVIRWGFLHTDLHRLELVVAEGNSKSARLAEKVGARREGLLRDRLIKAGRPVNAHMYSVLRFDKIPELTAG